MKSKTTLFDNDNDDLDINDCDEWFFDLILIYLIFDEVIDLILSTAISATQNKLTLKHYFFAVLIIFRKSNITFRVFVQIFFIKDFKVFWLSN